MLIVAAEKGFAADEGIELELVRKQSARGVLSVLGEDGVQIAHLPAPVPVGSAVGSMICRPISSAFSRFPSAAPRPPFPLGFMMNFTVRD
ncbi:ABC transporter substrate-binding protein [Bradyrhizobium lupini]|uniref:ABC transporter substrate-binding protein n=1 Tax=Rhizobium lupini TaxID=136996 RepID=UPI00296F0462